MDEVLTRGEIEQRYPSEWVLVDEPEVDEHLRLVRGKVLFHSGDREEMHRKDLELRPRCAAYLYTGTLSSDTVVVL